MLKFVVAESLEDDTRLSDNEIFYLSNKIGRKYNTLALLAGKSKQADIIMADNFNYAGPGEKATKILRYITNNKTFSRKQLANHLENMGLGNLAGELLRGEFRYQGSEDTTDGPIDLR